MRNSKLILLIFLGAFFWFVAAMTVRFLGDTVFTEHNFYRVLMFAAAFPITYVSLLISVKVAYLKKSAILNAVVIMTITATFLDGIAMTWFRQLYAETFEIALYGAAWILWGVGVGLLFAYFMSNEKEYLN